VSVQTSASVRLGGFVLDRSAGGLFRLDQCGNSVLVSLGSRALDVLCVLVEQAGELVSKDAIMGAVWPNTAVEENNLTVQISALRRVLDEGRTKGSYIQTVPGRGYRLIEPVHRANAVRPRQQRDNRSNSTVVENKTAIEAAAPSRPRLSIVVLPFDNLSGDPRDDYLADGITDDLTSDLSHIQNAFVVARQSAYSYKGKPRDVRAIGEELGVRYVLEGSVRRIGSTLRVNVQLISGETGAHLWSDRFDEQISELLQGQEQIVIRMRSELGINMVEIENARSLRERPANPDALDLILHARALENQPPNRQKNDAAKALYEQALQRDPSSALAMIGVAYHLVDRRATVGHWANFEDMHRAEKLLTQARAIAPETERLPMVTAYWLRNMDRRAEAMVAAGEAIRRFPNNPSGYVQLGHCKTETGHAEDEIPLQAQAIRLNPRDPYLFNRYRRMGFASLMLGRDQDAIGFLERSLAISRDDDDGTRTGVYRQLAAAHARLGQMAAAKRALAEADRLFPFVTVRSIVPLTLVSPVYVEQYLRFQDAVRLAGGRDHADEAVDFGVPNNAILHERIAGYTPTGTPGVKTIRTDDLAEFLADSTPIIVDTMTCTMGRSLPGAVGLKSVGLGGSFSDAVQDRLRSKIRELTGGDLHRPIVAVGWNSERFDGRNLALRLTALGYTQVYWYRGGREAWEVNGLPETELKVEAW
jgi:adenylate cyclase